MGGASANPLAPFQLLDPPQAASCELWLQFDFSQAAGSYSQLSGVLAGIAFLAIMLVLNRQHRRGSESDAAREYQQDNRFVTALAVRSSVSSRLRRCSRCCRENRGAR